LKISKILEKKNVEMKATHQEFDSTISIGRLMRGLLSVIAEFDNDLRKERQAEGIKSAL
jgi:DNA invertase Pin-like site-specific DNA recombinase